MDYSVYEKECNRIKEEILLFEKTYITLFEAYSKKVTRNEIGLGGELMHRGYYCPSIIADIIAGNVRRGQIVKTHMGQKKGKYIFGFDEDDKLVTVDRGFEKEVIIRKDDRELGIIFSQYGIEAISECYYEDNRIISYGYYNYLRDKGVCEYEKEIYTYTPNNLYVDWISYSNMCIQILQHNCYDFEIREGYLISYKVKEFKVDNNLDNLFKPMHKQIYKGLKREDIKYQVNLRRKIT